MCALSAIASTLIGRISSRTVLVIVITAIVLGARAQLSQRRQLTRRAVSVAGAAAQGPQRLAERMMFKIGCRRSSSPSCWTGARRGRRLPDVALGRGGARLCPADARDRRARGRLCRRLLRPARMARGGARPSPHRRRSSPRRPPRCSGRARGDLPAAGRSARGAAPRFPDRPADRRPDAAAHDPGRAAELRRRGARPLRRRAGDPAARRI